MYNIGEIKELVALFRRDLSDGKKLPTLAECTSSNGNDYEKMLALLCVKPDLASEPYFWGYPHFIGVNKQHLYEIHKMNFLAVAVELFGASPGNYVALRNFVFHGTALRTRLDNFLRVLRAL